MSILSDKSVLIVGDVTKDSHSNLEHVLQKSGMEVSTSRCEDVSLEQIEQMNIDIVLVDHFHTGTVCTKLLNELRERILKKNIAIFALVENSEESIRHALLLGATDYITPEESDESVLTKIKLAFGHPDNFSGLITFDVPLDTAKTTKSGIRVFMVEDDPLLRNLLATKLEASSFPCGFANDGTDVIKKIADFKPQVIILDLMLPVKNGFEILTELKASPTLSGIPVIVFSNKDSQEDKQKVFSLGADRYFVKAMTDLSVLIETIEDLAH